MGSRPGAMGPCASHSMRKERASAFSAATSASSFFLNGSCGITDNVSRSWNQQLGFPRRSRASFPHTYVSFAKIAFHVFSGFSNIQNVPQQRLDGPVFCVQANLLTNAGGVIEGGAPQACLHAMQVCADV